MRIAEVGARSLPARHGGLEVVVEALVEHMGKSNDVTAFVSEGGGEAPGKVVVTRAVAGKYTHTASQLLSSYSQLRSGHFDVVHIHGVGPSFITLLGGWGSSCICVTVHGIDWDRAKWPPLARRAFRAVAVAALKRATAVSAVSASTAELASQYIGRPVHVIENALDMPDEVDVADLELPAKYSTVISRLTPEKNIETILSAYTEDVAGRLGPLVIVGGGGGSYADDYEKKLIALAGANVLWFGQQDRSRALSILRKASLFIAASTLEAQPMSVIEAHALGKQLLLSDIPAHHEVAGQDALYFDPLNAPQLERLLMTIEAGAIPKRSSKWVDRTWDKVAVEYEEWFASCIETV